MRWKISHGHDPSRRPARLSRCSSSSRLQHVRTGNPPSSCRAKACAGELRGSRCGQKKPRAVRLAAAASRTRRSAAAIARRGRCRAVVGQFHRQQQIRFMRAPAIADAEIHRLRAPEQLGVGFLISAGEFVDRPGIAAEREEAPFLRIVIGERNAGIVLDDGGAVGEQEVAHGGEVAGVQQIGRALDQAVAGRERRAEFQEAARPDAGIGKIGREIIQRPFLRRRCRRT